MKVEGPIKVLIHFLIEQRQKLCLKNGLNERVVFVVHVDYEEVVLKVNNS